MEATSSVGRKRTRRLSWVAAATAFAVLLVGCDAEGNPDPDAILDSGASLPALDAAPDTDPDRDPGEQPIGVDQVTTDRACPFADDADIARLTGLQDMVLAKVLLPGDRMEEEEWMEEGFDRTIPMTSCTWGNDDGSWQVFLVVHRESFSPAMFAEARRDAEANGLFEEEIADVPGPWSTGFRIQGPQRSYVLAHSERVGIEAQILSVYVEVDQQDALPLALHLWDRL